MSPEETVHRLAMPNDSDELWSSPDAALRVEALLDGFESSRGAVQARLEQLDGCPPEQFLGFAFRFLARQKRDPGAGAKFLAELILTHPHLSRLISDPQLLFREEAELIMKAVTKVTPGLEGTLLQRFLHEEIREDRLPQLFRVLDLTASVDPVGRTNGQLTRLLNSKNPRVRAKIVQLLVGSTGSAGAAMSLLEDEDPRVQANVIESLWPQAANPNAIWLFRSRMDSPVVRVTTNALVGLVKAGDSDARKRLVANLRGDDVNLARAAAWAVGFLGDQRFREPLEEMLREGNVEIRGGILRALVRLNQLRQAERVPEVTFDVSENLEDLALEKVRGGAAAWNEWRSEHQDPMPNLDSASLQGAFLLGADFSFCSLRDVNLEGARLNLCSFFCADLSGTNLREARMERCDLRGVETDSLTDLSDAHLAGSTLYGLDLRGVPMRGVRWEGADLGAAHLDASSQERGAA
ncbi:MAG: HEAT repeat domain-containing protein [Bryobacterales bacterium]|nr:HEAT repeat domain-containing protein [Bryobacterales bacterium]